MFLSGGHSLKHQFNCEPNKDSGQKSDANEHTKCFKPAVIAQAIFPCSTSYGMCTRE